MTIANELELSTTDALNIDFKGVGILGSSSLANGDDAMRALGAMRAAAITRRVAKTGNATAAKTDHNQLWDFTAAATLTLTAAATLTSGWALWVKASGGTVTIDPNSSELIDGAATIAINPGTSCLLVCNGTAFYTLGNTEDAAFPRGHIFGLTLSNNGSDATNDIDIAAGEARDSSDAGNIVLAAALTKRLDASWAVGTGNGGLDTGSIADTTYHVWLIQRSDTGVVDALFSTSASSPTMPSNYDRKRRIGSIMRASSAIRAFTQRGDKFLWSAPVTDDNATLNRTIQLLSLTVPAGLIVEPLATGFAVQSGSGFIDVEVADGNIGTGDRIYLASTRVSGEAGYWNLPGGLFTDTSSRIYYKRERDGATTIAASLFSTRGWIDTRGRFA